MSPPIRGIIETHLILNTEDLGRELVGLLRSEFTKDNPDFYRKQRMGFYTGKIPRQLYSWKQDNPWLYLPRGAIDKVKDLLAEKKRTLEIIRDRSIRKEMRPKLEILKNLYPYQVEASQRLAEAGNAVVRGPCGSGKTIILLATMAELSQPTLIIVHSTALMKQWKMRIMECFDIIPGQIGGGGRPSIKPVTVGMQQSIWKCEGAPWLENFGCIIGDEVHHWAARTFQVTAGLFPAAYRIGASADERRKDGLEYMIYETFGPCVHTITKDELIQLKRLLPISMELVKTNYYDDIYVASLEARETPDWNHLINGIVTDEERNKLISDHLTRVLAESPHNRVLMLNDRVEACRRWAHVLSVAGIPAGVMLGGPENKDHLHDSIRKLHTGEMRVAIGTSVADEGLDIPPLTHVFLTCPVHNHLKRMEQMVGRTARVCGQKTHGRVVYFWDHLIWPRDREGDYIPRSAREKKFVKETFAKVADEITII